MTALRFVACVDDDPHMRQILDVALGEFGALRVVTYDSGAAALAGLAAEPAQLVLLDMLMPHMSGLDTLHAMRSAAALRDIPVVFVTAKADEGDAELYRAAGALAVVSKPIAPHRLHSQVREIWNNANERTAS